MMGLVKGHYGWCTSGVGMVDGVGEGTLWLVHQWGGDMDDGVGEGTLWLVHQWGGSDVHRAEPGVLAGMCETG